MMRDPQDNQRNRPLNEEPGRVERHVEEERYVADEPVSNRPAGQDLNRPMSRDVNRPLSRDQNPNLDRDRLDYSGTRYGSTGPYSNVALTDMVRWGPIIAGFAATVALLLLMGVLGAAIGATSMTNTAGQALPGNAGTFGVIWAALSLIVAFFVGGWLAARSAGLGGRQTALVNSSIVWAFTVLFLILFASFGVAGAIGLVNSIGLPTNATVSTEQSATAAWGTLIGLVVAWLSAIVGGLVGMHDDPNPVNR